MTRRFGEDWSYSRLSSQASSGSSYSSRLISSVSRSQSSYSSSYRNAYRSFPTASTSSSSSYSQSSLPYSRYSGSSSRIANTSYISSYSTGSNSFGNLGTIFRNRPSYDITRTVRSNMDNQFASDVRLQRSINNCIKATTDIGRKTDFLRHEMAQNRLNTIDLRERARDLKYRIDAIRSRSGPSYSSWEDYMSQR
ncbi:unnamed protein product [Oikopleura dioica]|uniref:Uncharacterized protein n=1 Tax=Oikopleura dioica TaxID=34765 RepID=E4X395_OIKDI|nr:unnamed protein product [Oikopleura dioica]